MIRLSRFETTVNCLIWSCGVFFALYNLHLVGKEFNHSYYRHHHFDDFVPGWFGRFQDVSDFEWSCWTRLFIYLTPWLLINCAGGLMVHQSLRCEILPLWYTAISVAATTFILNKSAAGLLVTIVLLFHLVSFLNQPFFIWLLALICRRYIPSQLIGKTEGETYLIEVASSWLILRCLAYSLEAVRGRRHSLPVFLGYAFYLPTLFCGPFLSFTSFFRHLLSTHSKPKFTLIFWSFIRCIFWYFFTVCALHFVYVNAILLRPYIVEKMTVWQLAGLGIAMGHFFHLKYVVFYGLPSSWAASEGYPTPPPPCCVSRVYLYSVMWRNFDPGLYSFLIRYIYIPIIKTLKGPRILARTIASIACFYFVFVWHGEEEYVFYWVSLNFLAVTIEGAGREINKSSFWERNVISNSSAASQRRFHCLIAAPLHYFSMISNYFFIGSLEVGKIYVMRAINESLINNLFILFFLYGAAQTTITIEALEKKRKTDRLS